MRMGVVSRHQTIASSALRCPCPSDDRRSRPRRYIATDEPVLTRSVPVAYLKINKSDKLLEGADVPRLKYQESDNPPQSTDVGCGDDGHLTPMPCPSRPRRRLGGCGDPPRPRGETG
jgi:hypothetical protein